MRGKLIALLISLATQAGAECGALCEVTRWQAAIKAELKAKFDTGEDLMARLRYGSTRLNYAAGHSIPENIQVLPNAGAYAMAKTLDGFTIRLVAI